MADVLVVVLLIAALAVAAIYIPRFLLRRATRNVVSLFRGRDATSPATATTLVQLGLVQRKGLERLTRVRDYRPYAMRLLTNTNVVRTTEEGTMYLSEETLEHSPVKKLARIE
jgi:hypothetical protein